MRLGVVEPMQYSFPGDEQISPADYCAAMNNSYTGGVYPLGAAFKYFGMPLSAQDHESAKRVLCASKWLDCLLDNSTDKGMAIQQYDQAILGLTCSVIPKITNVSAEFVTSLKLLQNSVRILPEQDLEALYNAAQRIGTISIEKADVRNVARYTQLIIEECDLSADTLFDSLSERTRYNPDFERVKAWGKNMVIFGGLGDSAIDLPVDVREGRVAIEPSRRNQSAIIGHAARLLPSVVRPLGLRGVRRIVGTYRAHQSLSASFR